MMTQTAAPAHQTPKPKPATAKPAAAQPLPAAPMTDDQKTIYALGLSIYRSLGQFTLSPSELEIVQQAITDAAAGKPAIDLNTWGPKIQPFARQRAAQAAEQQKAASQAYLEKAAAKPGATRTNSGLVYRELVPGTGPSPQASDTVKVNYRGTLIDGTEFDSSYSRNEPGQFELGRVIPCWTEGLQKMKVGGKAELVCPSSLAYGDQGRPGIPPGAALVFQVELLEIVNSTPAPAATPPSPAAPPAPATPPAPPQ
jgi:FKBP-type peptidyl-prolyl cis-trans isomerase FkpA